MIAQDSPSEPRAPAQCLETCWTGPFALSSTAHAPSQDAYRVGIAVVVRELRRRLIAQKHLAQRRIHVLDRNSKFAADVDNFAHMGGFPVPMSLSCSLSLQPPYLHSHLSAANQESRSRWLSSATQRQATCFGHEAHRDLERGLSHRHR